MDHCASVLTHFSPRAEDGTCLGDDAFDRLINVHVGRVQKLFKDSAGIVAAHSLQLLDCLDAATHTYSYLALLDIILPTEAALYDSIEPAISDKILAFLVAFDPRQVRYIGSAFTHVFTAVSSGRILPASVAVEALARALAKIDPTGCMMTSNHLLLAKLAYHTNNARAALPVLGRSIVFYPGMATYREADRLCSLRLPPPSYISKDTGLTLPLKSSQVLEFDYILGLLHSSVRDWAAAHEAFARVVSYPARDNGISKITVEAHKHWVLTGLLLYGKVAASPRQTSNATTKVCSTINKVYMQLVEHFDAPNATTLLAELVVSFGDVFAADGNLSLVHEVVAAHPKWKIARLRRVYTNVSLAAIRKTITSTPPATDSTDSTTNNDDDDYFDIVSLLQDMIDTGMIKAVIRRPSAATAQPPSSTEGIETTKAGGGGQTHEPYLEFLPEEEEMSEAAFATKIAALAAKVQALEPLHKTTNEHLSLNRDYVRQYIRELKREKEDVDRDVFGGGVGGASMYDVDVDEEDLMTDTMGGF
ncbi:cop9 subunit [Niveomyces insectorum RCEF 264]|uniref:Cop9 subunit n=1 Tax=Niveomyces insectorum RCEF 264 TaxID=1081102 RepID=A0A168A1A4_9HYPO|nr:cop9 subunit [Niveomyces insectorum RCEF 264]